MCSKLLLVVFSILYCKAINFNKNSSTKATYANIPLDAIESWLSKPLLNIEYVNLNLRSSSYEEDVANTYTKWFLRQTLVPITISIYELQTNANKLSDYTRNNNVIVTSMKDLSSTARRFEKRGATYFFIIIGDVDFESLRNFFYLFWKRLQIFKNFLLTNNGVLIYDPCALHESGSYGKVITYTGKDTIERTLFNDMRGYPMRIQLFKSVYSRPKINPISKKVEHVSGVDGRVARLLQEQMNFTADLQYPDPNYFGLQIKKRKGDSFCNFPGFSAQLYNTERSPNGSYNGVIGSIINNELDLCLTGFFIKEYMVPEMEFSAAVYDDKLCIFTPKAKQIPESILPIFAVSYDVWFSFILMAFVCSLLWTFLRMLNLHFISFQLHGRKLEQTFKWQYVQILIDTWVVWVRVNITHEPPFHSEKLFVASLGMISVIFGSIFESSLSTVFIHPLYYKDIHTLQELDESGLHIIYKYTSMKDDLFFSETSHLFANLHKKLRFEKDINAEVIEDVAMNGDKAGVSRYTNLMLQSTNLIVSKKVWIVPECPKYYTISYVWPKNAPWDTTVNQLLLRMLNAGLINKYIADMQVQADIRIMRDHLYEMHEDFKVLTMEDLQLAFYVILTGSLIASLTLLVERKLFSNKDECLANRISSQVI